MHTTLYTNQTSIIQCMAFGSWSEATQSQFFDFGGGGGN